MKFLFKAILLLLLISADVSVQGQAETIPEFNFFDLTEKSFTNKNLASGKMLFFVYFDATCDHCQHAISYINQHIAEFNKAAIYLVTLDSKEKIKQFMSKYGPSLQNRKNVTILQDRKYEFLPKFKPVKYPSLFLYSAQKKLLLYDDNEQNLPRFTKQINAPVK